MKHQALQMYNYHVWANDKIFSHLRELPADMVEQEIQSVFSTIKEVIIHIYVFDHVWFGVMREKSMEGILAVMEQLNEEMPSKSMDEIEQMQTDFSKEYKAFFEQQADMDRLIPCEHPQWGKKDIRLSEMVHHVVNHGTYHRGNITAMLRQLGHKGIPTDYAYYLFELNR